jgi:hypothetical protein
MRAAALFFALCSALPAQDQPPVVTPVPVPVGPPPPPALEFTGKPIVVPFRCTDEDIRSAGLACTDDEPCPVYLELTSLASSGIRLFTAGNIHTATVTLLSIVLGSDDNGHTWREVFERLRGSGYDAIQFVGSDNAWISGLSLVPLPQDPFLLKTNDGGKTWRQSPLSSEPLYGSIQQFRFDDATNGALILDHGPGSGSDRYERYESVDGGDSWTAKETSVKPLALKRTSNAAAAAQSEWRVRADANSRSFQLEHRSGGRWTSVAAFAVNLGVCRPER